jgi:hypothetical protein
MTMSIKLTISSAASLIAIGTAASPIASVRSDDLAALYQFHSIGTYQEVQPGAIVATSSKAPFGKLLCQNRSNAPILQQPVWNEVILYNWVGEALPSVAALGRVLAGDSSAHPQPDPQKIVLVKIEKKFIEESRLNAESIALMNGNKGCSDLVIAHLKEGYDVCPVAATLSVKQGEIKLAYQLGALCINPDDGSNRIAFAPAPFQPFWERTRASLGLVQADVTF